MTKQEPVEEDMKQVLIIPDVHIPFEDKRAYGLMLEVAQDIPALEEIVILGDFADFYGASSYAKDPSIKSNLLTEIRAVNNRLDELDTLFPGVNKVFIEGNHENRLTRFITSKSPELFGMITTEELFRLDERGYTFVPYTPNQIHRIAGSSLYARHEGIGGVVHVAYNSVVKAGCSVIFGHNHRIQENQVVTINGDNLRGICSGWLGDKDSPVMSYVQHHHQWSLGFSVVDILDEGIFFNHLVHIIDYKCSYNGTIYYG